MNLTLALLTITVCSFVSIQGFRHKRDSMRREECPKNVDCAAYAKEEAKKLGPCSTYRVNEVFIAYFGCGVAICEENSREVRDWSKPYPDCCPDCEVIDPDKPAKFFVSL